MNNKKIVLGIFVGFVVVASGASILAYKCGYSDGFVVASNKTNESWLAQSRGMINEDRQFMRAFFQPATK